MARVEELSFSELVQELARFEHDSGPPDLEKSIRRRSIDARLMRLLAADAPADERRSSVRVPGDMGVKLHASGRTVRGAIVDIGEGGLRVHIQESELAGDTAEVELDGVEGGAKASARIMWKKARESGLDLGLHFDAQNEAHRRRMRRLVLEILRRMPEPPAAA